jgi:hypothetical protein
MTWVLGVDDERAGRRERLGSASHQRPGDARIQRVHDRR